MEKYAILEIYHLPSGNDMASAVIARFDDRDVKYNVLLQSKPGARDDGRHCVMVLKYNKACNSIDKQFNCYASDNAELSKWTKNTIIVNEL